MRKLTHLLLAAGLVLGLASSAKAGEFVPGESNMSVILGGLPSITFTATPGTELLVGLIDQLTPPFGHFAGAAASVWSTVNFGPGTSLFTGVPLISNLKLTAKNNFGNIHDGFTTASNPMSNGGKGLIGPTLGGHIRLTGITVIKSLGESIKVGLAHVGGLMGETTNATLLTVFNIIATNGPFVTTSLVITRVTSNLISVPGRSTGQKTGVGFTLQPATNEFVRTFNTTGGFQSLVGGSAAENHTVTISGTNNLASGSLAGTVTVVAPLRIDVDTIAGVIPGVVSIGMSFVPEPGSMLLLLSGAVGLAVIGRRRMRK
jgi:hypothetical protein